MTQMGLFHVWRLDLTLEKSISELLKKNHMITSIEKSLDKIQHPFLVKLLANKKQKGTFLT